MGRNLHIEHMFYNLPHYCISARRKEGATLPTLPDYRNGSSPSCSSWCGRPFGDSDIDKYHELIRDPALWVLKAEERSAFKSVVTLIDKPFGTSFSI